MKIGTEKSDLTPKELYELRNGIRQTFVQALGLLGGLLGGGALLLGLFYTARTVRTAQQTLWVNQETLRITQEGQITERFTRAIEHLGDTRLTVRLGGIYALERIARDSPGDHWPIMEVLTTYVRDNAPWPPKNNQPSSSPEPFQKLATDIQAILTVLGRRTRSSDRERENELDLAKTDLRRVRLAHAHLESANLRDAHLEGAYLLNAHLEGASLIGTYLENAILAGAHLEGASLYHARLEDADLTGAHLEGADLRACLKSLRGLLK
jgi:hypothetical protein